MDKQQLISNLKSNIPSHILYGTLNYQGREIVFDTFIDKVIFNATDLPDDVNVLLGKLQAIIQTVKPANQTLLNLKEVINSNPSYNEKITTDSMEEISYAEVLMDKYNKGLIDEELNVTVGDQKKTIEEFYKTFLNNKKVTFEDKQKRIQESIDRALSNENEYNKNKILDYVINETSNETLKTFLLNDIALCIEGEEVYFGDEHAPIEYFVSEAINGVRMNLYNNRQDDVASVDLIPVDEVPQIDDKGVLIHENDTKLEDILNEYSKILVSFRTVTTQAELDEINKFHVDLMNEIESNPIFMTNSLIQYLELKYKADYEEVSKRVMKVNFSSKEINEALQGTIKELVSKYKNATDKSSFSMAAKSQFDIKNNCDKIGIRNRATNQLFDDLNELANYQVSLLKEERRDVLMNSNTVEERKENGKIVFLNKIKRTKDLEEQRRKAEAFEKAKGSSEITREILETQGVKLAA
jgi:hypothetical protein